MFFFCCLCFWYHIQEIIAKSNVMKIFPFSARNSISFSSAKTTQVQTNPPIHTPTFLRASPDAQFPMQ